MKELSQKLAQDYGLKIKDLSLLETAFTHTSYANEHRLLKISHNERLEFLGDAVLQLIISRYLFEKYPDKTEGDMSKLRSSFVREESLAGFSRACGFDRFIRLGKGEEKSGGRHRDTILGDAFEAFLGAIYLDQGMPIVEGFIHQVMIPKLEEGKFEKVVDYKTQLQEMLQVNGDIEIDYEVVAESGPAHDRRFEVVVKVRGQVLGHGQGRSKKMAEQEAAKDAVLSGEQRCI